MARDGHAPYCSCGRLATQVFVECFHDAPANPLRTVWCCHVCAGRLRSLEAGRETFVFDKGFVTACGSISIAVALRSLERLQTDPARRSAAFV